MTLDDLEEALADILPAGFSIEKNKHGEVIIFTGLSLDDDGELDDFESDDEDEDPDLSDEGFEPLEDENLDEDE